MRLIDADALDLDREVELADDWKTAHEIANCVKYAPTVHAVPLDKLCEWLSRNAWAFDCEGCEGYCRAMVECDNEVGNNPEYWKDKLINWMEEQNEG